MRTSDELFPPVQYAWGWVMLAIGILVLLVVAAAIVILLTQPLKPPPTPPPVPSAIAKIIAELRHEYQLRLDDIAKRFEAGEIDAREAHAETSSVVRGFVNEYGGIETPVFSLSDLRRTQLNPSLVNVVGASYPSIFQAETPADPSVAIAAAREVVAQWY